LTLGLQPVVHVAAMLAITREEQLIGSAGNVFFARMLVHHQCTSLQRLSGGPPRLHDVSMI
jgi:hypothetical protein